jgi:hypothetical protein
MLRRSNHTLFRTARKERLKLCGIFARDRRPSKPDATSRFSSPRNVTGDSFNRRLSARVAIRANLTANVVETRQFFGLPHAAVLFVAEVTV